MIVELDDFAIGSNTIYDITNIDGLGPSDIRTSSFNYSGRSGGLVTNQFYGMRLLTVTGIVRSYTCDQHQNDREAFDSAAPIDTLIPVHITVFSGDKFVIYANVLSLHLEYKPGGQFSDFKLELLAGDPLFYSEDGGAIQTATVDRVESGGYETPYILPVEWEPGGQPTVVINSGSFIAYPLIKLYDEAANPIITNQTTGESFQLDINMVDGDEVIIDTRNRTVTLNGSNIIGNKTTESVWWGLQVGNNSILLDSDSGSDTVYAEIEWSNGRSGI